MVVILVRACMFCLLCATHTHCSSHHTIENSHITSGLKASYENGRENNGQISPDSNKEMASRLKSATGDDHFINMAFKIFGDGEKLTQDGFKNFLSAVGFRLNQGKAAFLKTKTEKNVEDTKNGTNTYNTRTTGVGNNTSEECMTFESVIGESKDISQTMFHNLCPWILYHMIPNNYSGASLCDEEHHKEKPREESRDSALVVWVYATISVCLISLCGLLAVAVIPLMQRTIYHSLLQFLVALAVGTLCGDALLHLLPHAMLSTHGHHHDHEHGSENSHSEQHDMNLWKGFVAVIAVVFFYFTEKCLSIVTEWRKRRQRRNKTNNTRVRVMREETQTNEEDRVGEKLCKHKYSSYPYCYGEITNSGAENHTHNGPVVDGEINNISHIREENGLSKHEEIDMHKEDLPCSEKQLLEASGDQLPEYTVILREHETRHHGHAHTHGHVHSAPGSLSSVAWMIIMGDGLHNLADGLAIGTAFGANIGGGVSTAVAVFCHELPHEIGDFAVLLKAGMSAKQAVFYNFLSSVLCFIGMSLGVFLGHNETMQSWVFSFAAGMFLYIALVDMVPELSSSHSKEGGSLCQCLLQLCGLMTGIGIMMIIALYEEVLKESFQHSF